MKGGIIHVQYHTHKPELYDTENGYETRGKKRINRWRCFTGALTRCDSRMAANGCPWRAGGRTREGRERFGHTVSVVTPDQPNSNVAWNGDSTERTEFGRIAKVGVVNYELISKSRRGQL